MLRHRGRKRKPFREVSHERFSISKLCYMICFVCLVYILILMFRCDIFDFFWWFMFLNAPTAHPRWVLQKQKV